MKAHVIMQGYLGNDQDKQLWIKPYEIVYGKIAAKNRLEHLQKTKKKYEFWINEAKVWNLPKN